VHGVDQSEASSSKREYLWKSPRVSGMGHSIAFSAVEVTFMKSYASRILLCSALGVAPASAGAAQGRRGRRGSPPSGQPPAQAGMYTTISGKILQFNYDRDAEVEVFC
jgi:hypothetical protein